MQKKKQPKPSNTPNVWEQLLRSFTGAELSNIKLKS